MLKKIILFVCLIGASVSFAQTEDTVEIDPSKPTNLYTQINTLGELNAYDGFNTYGTRINFQYAFNPDNLVLAEVPLLYNDATSKFGLSDIRVRYFRAVKRNISKSIIAIAPFADITIPTGSAQNGLGSDTWSIAAGAVVGIVLNEKLSLFPGANYVYLTASKESGLGLQTNMSLKFNKRTFMFVNPMVTFFDFETVWQGELNLNYIVTPSKFKVNLGWVPNFTYDINTIRVGATFFI